MRARTLIAALLVLAITQMGAITCDPANGPGTIKITSPTGDVTTASFTIEFDLVGGPFTGTPLAFLNFQPLVVSGGPTTFTASVTGGATVDPGSPLKDDNLIVVKATRQSDGVTVTAGEPFAYGPPKARAFQIGDLADCPVSGPLAHQRVGDYCLQNAVARFVVQDVTAPAVPTDDTPRDLYSVGQYGGNLIDAVLVSNPTTDNFLEFAPMLNIETVANHQTIVVDNDGADGAPAVIRACGPDDLLDFANASSQLIDFGLNPAGCVPLTRNCTDDNDQDIEACTTYTLAPGDSHVHVVTEVMNNEGVDLAPYVGDWMNAAGEVSGFFLPNKGVGEAIFNLAASMAWFAEPGVEHPDRFEYGYVSHPSNGQSSYVTVSGVTIQIHNLNAVLALIGSASPFAIPAGGTNSFSRYFSVGEGRANSANELSLALRGVNTGTVQGCVTIGGQPAPNVKVSFGPAPAGVITAMIAHFVTDASGCYSGQMLSVNNTVMWGGMAAKRGVLYEGGTLAPPATLFNLFPAGEVETIDFALPATGTLHVDVVDENSSAVPARITVVGFDPSPEPTQLGAELPGFGASTLGTFHDVNDDLVFGLVAFDYTGADGISEFELEPGSYHVYVTRGTEYSSWSTLLPPSSGPITVTGGVTTNLSATIAAVLDTPGFVSSDFHVHGISSADSQVSDVTRAEQFAGEGVDNIVATDHHAHKDYKPTIAALGLSSFVTATIGEEITTFDYGHFNGYPYTIDPNLPSGGSTDWADPAPPGMDFPSFGAYNLSPAGILALALGQPTATASTTAQINHIDSHFGPTKINTATVPPSDGMNASDRLNRRLDPANPPIGQLYAHFPALELWNGYTRGHQDEFFDGRIGIWTNLLDQGLKTTAIADTDTHTFRNLRTAGARSWTAASGSTDTPATFDEDEMAASVDAGRAVGGQGIYMLARLLADDLSGNEANLTAGGSTTVTSSNGNVTLEISVQSPKWAQWDTIEIYSNAFGNVSGVPLDVANPYLYGATPFATLGEGDCDPGTTGDGDFDITVTNVHPSVADAERWETTVQVPVVGLAADTWFFALARGTDGVCEPMFPVYPASLDSGTNTTLADLVDGNLGENGVMALGLTNALFFTP